MGDSEPEIKAPPDGSAVATKAWRMMGGIDWSAFPVICEHLGVKDPSDLIDQLLTIKAFFDDGRT